MKALFIHSKFFKYKVRQKTKLAEDITDEEKRGELENCLVVMFAVEKEDEKKKALLEKLVAEIDKVTSQVKVKNITVFPFVHLTEEPSSPAFAQKFGKGLQAELGKKYSTMKVPFGWIKNWGFETAGHPLAVLSRRL